MITYLFRVAAVLALLALAAVAAVLACANGMVAVDRIMGSSFAVSPAVSWGLMGGVTSGLLYFGLMEASRPRWYAVRFLSVVCALGLLVVMPWYGPQTANMARLVDGFNAMLSQWGTALRAEMRSGVAPPPAQTQPIASNGAPATPTTPAAAQSRPSNPPDSSAAADAQAALAAGWDALNNGEPDAALADFQKAAQGDSSQEAAIGISKTSDAMFDMGNCYQFGLGVSKDASAAEKWYGKAARLGNSLAAESLGDMCYLGDGIGRNYDRARQLYELNGGPHTASGQRNLGKIYLNGLKVAVDRAKGIQLLQEAARQADAEAKTLLKGQGESW
jgi:hypothetical protein